jgi:uncharacterized LabA/DUF88 family protein
MAIRRANIYVDGYNLYFGILESNRRDLLWINLETLIRNHLKSTETLHRIHYFTTIPTSPPDKVVRHKIWLNVLESISDSIIIHRGKYNYPRIKCPRCKNTFIKPTEKKTDVNIACQLLADAHNDDFEVAYIVSGDSDLIPVIDTAKNLFTKRKIKAMFPPNRINSELIKKCDYVVYLNTKRLEPHKLPDHFMAPNGKVFDKPLAWA